MWKQCMTGLALVASLGLVGCGGGGSSHSDSADSSGTGTGSAKSAQFVDNAVTGLEYTCGSSSTRKITGDQGLLTCNEGQTVQFFVGDVALGSVTMTSRTAFITPADLAGAGADETSNVVINMTRLLMSLDADQDLSNGIQIDPASRIRVDMAVNFDQDPGAFETAIGPVLAALTQNVANGPFALVSESDAQDHITLALYLSNAGFYQGTIQRGPDSSSEIAFMVTRQGAAYGTNETAQGLYAASAFGTEEQLSTTGQGINFKVDGSTGATYRVGVTMKDGVATGTSAETAYPTFTATRSISFEPVYDQTVVEKFHALLPLAVDLGSGASAPFIIGTKPLTGAAFGQFDGGTPPSQNAENDLPNGSINFAEVVSAGDNKIRVLAMSISGYVVDLTMDFSGNAPTMQATWKHLHENRGGTTQTFTPNALGGDGPP